MKRMIFIRIALSLKQGGLKALLAVAAMTFMGTVSVSAQSYYTTSQALAVTEATLSEYAHPAPAKSAPASSTLAGPNTPTANSPAVNNNSIASSFQIAYLLEVRANLTSGLGTQAAIEQVYNNLAPNASGTRITLLGAAKAFVVDLLSN